MRKRNGSLEKFLTWLKKHYMFIVVAVFLIIGIRATMGILERGAENQGNKSDKLYLLVDAGGAKLAMYEPRSFNALSSTDEDIVYFNQLIYSSLFKLDSGLNITPDLVNYYSVDTDKGGVYIDLKPEAKFSDGTPVTASDVQRTITRIKEIGYDSPYYRYASKVSNVMTYDEDSLYIQFQSIEDAALDNLVFPIISMKDYNFNNNFSKGSGPFSYAEYKEGKSIKLDPNPNYYGTPPAYAIDIMIVQDKDKVLGLMTMDAVTAYLNRSSGADVQAEGKSLKYQLIPSGELEYIGFNMRNEYTSKKEVRQAISYAIDREKIIEDDYAGLGTVSDSLYYPGFLGADKNKGISKDTKKTTDSLASINLKDIDEDGVIETESGEDWSLTMIVSKENTGRADAAQNIVTQLEDVGIKIELQVLDKDAYAEKLEAGEFDIYFGGIKMDKQFKMTELFQSHNYINYDNKEILSKIRELEKAHTAEELTQAFESLKTDLNDDLPYFSICYRTYCFTTVDTFTQKEDPLYFNPYRDIANWRWQKRMTVDSETDAEAEAEEQ